MLVVLVLIFIVLPIAELYVIIQVGEAIGAIPTIGILILDSLVGAWLWRHQGRAAWRRFNAALQEGRVPAREVLDGTLVIFGGALLITPGFISDVVGILLLLPPTRAVSVEAGRPPPQRLVDRGADAVGLGVLPLDLAAGDVAARQRGHGLPAREHDSQRAADAGGGGEPDPRGREQLGVLVAERERDGVGERLVRARTDALVLRVDHRDRCGGSTSTAVPSTS